MEYKKPENGESAIDGYFRDVYTYNKKSEWEIVE